jgi:hypothetical protein
MSNTNGLSTIPDPSNLADLLFSNEKKASYFVGSARVVSASDAATASVVHGRGVVATRDIRAGECLFVTPPVVTAPVELVAAQWRAANANERLSQLAEQVLVQDMQGILSQPAGSGAAQGFLALVGAADDDDSVLTKTPSMACLLGIDGLTSTTTTTPATPDLYQSVRRNAFASDAPTLDSIERTWKDNFQQDKPLYVANRLMGLYPLAAMLNHSCVPNAMRVFAGDTMMVHAASDIKAGQEIRWSYVPPTLAFPVRDERLRT